MSPEERERKRLWMVEYNRRRKACATKTAQADLDDLNAICSTCFRLGQQITAMGVRGTVSGALEGGYLLVKHKGRTYHINPHDAYPAINLSGTVTFDGWIMGPNGKLKIKKG